MLNLTTLLLIATASAAAPSHVHQPQTNDVRCRVILLVSSCFCGSAWLPSVHRRLKPPGSLSQGKVHRLTRVSFSADTSDTVAPTFRRFRYRCHLTPTNKHSRPKAETSVLNLVAAAWPPWRRSLALWRPTRVSFFCSHQASMMMRMSALAIVVTIQTLADQSRFPRPIVASSSFAHYLVTSRSAAAGWLALRWSNAIWVSKRYIYLADSGLDTHYKYADPKLLQTSKPFFERMDFARQKKMYESRLRKSTYFLHH